MKLLIKIIILFILITAIILSVWARPILRYAAENITGTRVHINRAVFVPQRLLFRLRGIGLPEKNLLFTRGTVSIVPLGIKVYGIKFKDSTVLSPQDFMLTLTKHRRWEIDGWFKGVKPPLFSGRFKKGSVSGKIEGIYNNRQLTIYGTLLLRDIVYTGGEAKFLGVPADKLLETGELDFTYTGPPDELDNLSHYRPGQKTISRIKDLWKKSLL